MKFAEELFPKGTFPNQQTDGLYIDETKAENFHIMTKSMWKDLALSGIYSGNDQSGTGKSTALFTDACFFTCDINKIYNLKNTFTNRNVFFKADDLIKEAPILAKEQPYSVLVLDEPDDLTIHQSKQRAHELRRVFRKLRQLNVILLLTSHSFFELPKFYALNRAQFLINVKFEGEFDRGFFKFYGPKSKKLLYLRGKKEWDYDAVKEDFQGRFGSHYAFFPNCKEETELYKKRKYQDMMEEIDGKDNKKELPDERIRKIKIQLFKKIHKLSPEITIVSLSRGFEISTKTAQNWLKKPDEILNSEEEECEQQDTLDAQQVSKI